AISPIFPTLTPSKGVSLMVTLINRLKTNKIRQCKNYVKSQTTNQRDGSFGLLVCFCCNKQAMCQRI
ncbi:MAG: hypothetical protein SPG92_03660, partial [Sodaliphilus sp.]|nr:hypothetical protein [Sodaliphilus sp.]